MDLRYEVVMISRLNVVISQPEGASHSWVHFFAKILLTRWVQWQGIKFFVAEVEMLFDLFLRV